MLKDKVIGRLNGHKVYDNGSFKYIKTKTGLILAIEFKH